METNDYYFNEMKDATEFLELYGKNQNIVVKQITVAIQTIESGGTAKSVSVAIPPKLEKHVKKLVAKKIRWIKKAS
jgi:hypothetical protein